MDNNRILIIVNPIAGTGRKDDIARLAQEELGIGNARIAYTERAGHAREMADEAVARGTRIVVAVGGDGTVNEVAGALIGSDTALAVVPLGSGNGLARHLRVPLNARKALRLVRMGHIERFDCGIVNGDIPFFCTCGVGFDAQVSHAFATAGTRGLTTYVRTTISEYFRYKPQHYRITIDDDVIDDEAFVIAVGNAAQYGNNALIAPRATMQDGQLDITVIHRFSLVAAPLVGARLFTGTLENDSHISIYRGRHIEITRDSSGPMHIDGDPYIMPATLTIDCRPAALPVVIDRGEKKK